MSILNMMFNAGDNSLVSAQWELLETPPAISWRNMLEYSMENPRDNPLSLTEATFCASKGEAQSKWSEIRSGLAGFNHSYSKMPFANLKHKHAAKIVEDLQNILEKGLLNSLDKAFEIKAIVDKLKDVMFYLDHVKASEFNNGNEGSSYGQILHIPDPHFAIAFKPEWRQYLTLDIEPGTVYAELTYADLAWHQILEFESIEAVYEPMREKRFGPPAFLGSGFIIPMGKDLGGIEVDLLEFFYKHIGALQYLDSAFDPMYSLRSAGRIPIAKLKTKIGEAGYPGYKELMGISSMFKLEIYEDY